MKNIIAKTYLAVLGVGIFIFLVYSNYVFVTTGFFNSSPTFVTGMAVVLDVWVGALAIFLTAVSIISVLEE